MLNEGYFLNSYKIQSVIGHGGFGIVYKGTHKELNIEVAIKEYFPSELSIRRGHTVHPKKLESQPAFEENLDRFIQEAQQLQNFRNCPNIVTCRDLFRANGTAYIIMDFVHGLPLSSLLEQREGLGEPFTQQDLLQVIVPLVNGVQTIHESDVCHRDIKPSNILIRSSDRAPVLIDFGAAKHEVSKDTKSSAPYSDGYAAMEQIGDGEIGPWTDIYGIGAVMWRMVAGGNPPFSPPNPLPTQQRVLKVIQGYHDPLPSAKEIGDGRFSDDLLHTIDRCLTVNPNDRIKSCHALLSILSDSGVQTPPTISPRPVISEHDIGKPPTHQIRQIFNTVNLKNFSLMMIGGTLTIIGVIVTVNHSHDLANAYLKNLELLNTISSTLWTALLSSIGFWILTWTTPFFRTKYYTHSHPKIHAEGQAQTTASQNKLNKNLKNVAVLCLQLISMYVFFIGIFVSIYYITHLVVRPRWLLLLNDIKSDLLGASILVVLFIAIGLFTFRVACNYLKK